MHKTLDLLAVCQRMPPYYSVFVMCLKLLSDVLSVYQRTCWIVHTSAYVGAIRRSVTRPLGPAYVDVWEIQQVGWCTLNSLEISFKHVSNMLQYVGICCHTAKKEWSGASYCAMERSRTMCQGKPEWNYRWTGMEREWTHLWMQAKWTWTRSMVTLTAGGTVSTALLSYWSKSCLFCSGHLMESMCPWP